MSTKWVWTAAVFLIVFALFGVLLPQISGIAESIFVTKCITPIGGLNLGIATAVFCITVFLFYTIVIKKRRH